MPVAAREEIAALFWLNSAARETLTWVTSVLFRAWKASILPSSMPPGFGSAG